jgi:hypothetical protein
MRAKVTNMREKYDDIINRINSAAQGGEDNIVLENSKERPFCNELFVWLKSLGFRITYIRRGYILKSNMWDCSDDEYDYTKADWVRIAW